MTRKRGKWRRKWRRQKTNEWCEEQTCRLPESVVHPTQGESKLDCATKSGAIQHVLPPRIWVHYNANVIR